MAVGGKKQQKMGVFVAHRADDDDRIIIILEGTR